MPSIPDTVYWSMNVPGIITMNPSMNGQLNTITSGMSLGNTNVQALVYASAGQKTASILVKVTDVPAPESIYITADTPHNV
jgi:hypothetical protein